MAEKKTIQLNILQNQAAHGRIHVQDIENSPA